MPTQYTEETLSIVASNLTAAYFASIPDAPPDENVAEFIYGEEDLTHEPTRVQEVIRQYNFIRDSLRDHSNVQVES